jgi:hypothetical protein
VGHRAVREMMRIDRDAIALAVQAEDDRSGDSVLRRLPGELAPSGNEGQG